MQKLSKRRQALSKIAPGLEPLSLKEALPLMRLGATAKFDESVDLSVCLGIDPRKANQIVRGSILLPHGIGKKIRVAVFAQGEKAIAAQEAGADIVGFEDLAAHIKSGSIDFDVVIATPDAMRIVGQLGQILGPRGLMPSPKVGTVTQDVAKAVAESKFGKIQYKTDRSGIIHVMVGRASFPDEALHDNVKVFMDAILKAKPAMLKGNYIGRIFLSSTMGFSVRLDQSSLFSSH